MAISNKFGGKVVHVENMEKVMAILNDFEKRDMAKAVSKAFSRTAKKGIIAGKRELRRGLTNRSRYITQGVKGSPITASQRTSFQRSFNTHFIADGSVYIRGANTPKRDLDFLMDHEYGKNRIARSKSMAIPLKGLREWKGGRDYRTGGGKTKASMKPSRLLGDIKSKEYSKIKNGKSYLVVYTGKTRGKRKGKGSNKHNKKPFIMTRSNGARTAKKSNRYKGQLKYLYKFQKITDQTHKIHFGDSVEASIKANLRRDLIRQVRKIIPTTTP